MEKEPEATPEMELDPPEEAPATKARGALSAPEREKLLSKLRSRAEMNLTERVTRSAKKGLTKPKEVLKVKITKKRKTSSPDATPYFLTKKCPNLDSRSIPFLPLVEPISTRDFLLEGDYTTIMISPTFLPTVKKDITKEDVSQWVLKKCKFVPFTVTTIYHYDNRVFYARKPDPPPVITLEQPDSSKTDQSRYHRSQQINVADSIYTDPGGVIIPTTHRLTSGDSCILSAAAKRILQEQKIGDTRIPILRIKNGKIHSVEREPIINTINRFAHFSNQPPDHCNPILHQALLQTASSLSTATVTTTTPSALSAMPSTSTSVASPPSTQTVTPTTTATTNADPTAPTAAMRPDLPKPWIWLSESGGYQKTPEAVTAEPITILRLEKQEVTWVKGVTKLKLHMQPDQTLKIKNQIQMMGVANVPNLIFDIECKVIANKVWADTKITNVTFDVDRFIPTTFIHQPLAQPPKTAPVLPTMQLPKPVPATAPRPTPAPPRPVPPQPTPATIRTPDAPFMSITDAMHIASDPYRNGFPPKYAFCPLIKNRMWPTFHYIITNVSTDERDCAILQTAALFRVPPSRIAVTITPEAGTVGTLPGFIPLFQRPITLRMAIKIPFLWNGLYERAEYKALNTPEKWFRGIKLIEDCFIEAIGEQVFGTIDYRNMKSRNAVDAETPVQQWQEIRHPDPGHQVFLKYGPWSPLATRTQASAAINTKLMTIEYPASSDQPNWVSPPDPEKALNAAVEHYAALSSAQPRTSQPSQRD